MRFNSPQEVKEAAERNAASLYRRHVEKGHDLNPYCTQGARAEFDRAYANAPRYTWEGGTDYDYRHQLGRAVARIVENGAF